MTPNQSEFIKMRSFVVAALALASFAVADEIRQKIPGNTAYGYLANIGIPQAERIRQAEEKGEVSRIVGGLPAALGQYPYQAGLIINLIGLDGRGVCGGSVLSNNRVITAAHCWFDGVNQAWKVTVVLGSNTLFTGGTRLDTSVAAVHPNWTPALVRNDVAVIYLPNAVAFSNVIAPISLPSASELNENFVGETAIASGFGITSDDSGISTNQSLSHVSLNVISNWVCSLAFPLVLQDNNICTSGIRGSGTCNGDSGGPLVVIRGDRNILIGVVSFGSALGCQMYLPAAYSRVTAFVDFFSQHM